MLLLPQLGGVNNCVVRLANISALKYYCLAEKDIANEDASPAVSVLIAVKFILLVYLKDAAMLH